MQQTVKDISSIALIGGLFFLPFLGGVHLFDWDEINFAEAAREMLVSGDYMHVQIDYLPFWEKPPLFLWLQVLGMKLFGVGEYAARFPNAICGIITLVFLYLIGKRHFSRSFGWIWSGAYLGSILPHLYFKSGIIDPWFNLLIFLSLYSLTTFIYWKKEKEISTGIFAFNLHKKYINLVLSGALLGLAILTKGPAALLIVSLVLAVHWLGFMRLQFFISLPQFLLYTVAALSITAIWFGIEIIQNGTWFVEEFIVYQYRLFSTPDAGHGGFFGYHFVVLLLGCFPASFFALRGMQKTSFLTANQSHLKHFMALLFWVVLILFSIVQSKIVHYSSLCYYPITFFAALAIWGIYTKKINFPLSLKISLLSFGVLVGLIFIALPFVGQNIDLLKPLFEKDAFAKANLEAEVQWTIGQTAAGLFMVIISLLSFYFFKIQNIKKGIVVLFVGMAIFVNLTLVLIINNIESYSQRAAIEFYKALVDEEVYVKTVGFKSYAHLFYSKKQGGGDPRQTDTEWLINGTDVDRPVYLVTKIDRTKWLDSKENLVKIKEKNGFVFYTRKDNK